MPESNNTQAVESIERAKGAVQTSRDLLLKTFAFVPDEKLNWSPSTTARTPLQIAAHCGGANATFATLLRGEPWPLAKTAAEANEQIRNGPTEIHTREAAVQKIEDSAAALVAALEKATPATLETMLWTAFGEFPYGFAMTFPAEHMAGHARQIDYLETIWGDQVDHN